MYSQDFYSFLMQNPIKKEKKEERSEYGKSGLIGILNYLNAENENKKYYTQKVS